MPPKWLTLGLYDNVVFSRFDYFDFSILNPVIFLVAAQQEKWQVRIKQQ